jgi:glycine/D-amino acid oxidase-like deaminating enzyme/nitrite reductase/ring-hydroxylating ferredoxin subunit
MIRFAGKHGPVWQAQPPRAHYPRLGRDLSVDVAIVGGGITGLTAAWLLKKSGRRVAVLELNDVGRGSTGHSSGHLTALPDRSVSKLVDQFGTEGAKTAIRCGMEAIDLIESISEMLGDVGFERMPGFLFTEQEPQVEQLRRDADLAMSLGLAAEVVASVPVPFPVRAALRVDRQAGLDPQRYLEALVERVAGEGSHVFEHTRVEEIEPGSPCRVLAGSHVVHSKAVIEATHTPLNRSLGIQSRVIPYMSYLVGLKVDEAVPQALLWDTDEPYHYLRSVRQDTCELLLVGGEDRKTGQEHDPVARLEELLKYARRHYSVQSVEWSWSAQLFESADGLPYVGRHPGQEQVFVAGGYSGTGLTWGTMAGSLLASSIQGIESPALDLFSPARIKPLAVAKEFLRENFNVAWHRVVDQLRLHQEQGGHPLKPRQGRIMSLEGRDVAVYLDETSQLHVLSPVCTHAGGIVAWNDLEKTWDCPCHGGRYLPTGQVLCSPPTQPLEKIPEAKLPSPSVVGL